MAAWVASAPPRLCPVTLQYSPAVHHGRDIKSGAVIFDRFDHLRRDFLVGVVEAPMDLAPVVAGGEGNLDEVNILYPILDVPGESAPEHQIYP